MLISDDIYNTNGRTFLYDHSYNFIDALIDGNNIVIKDYNTIVKTDLTGNPTLTGPISNNLVIGGILVLVVQKEALL